jgi:hypothetical protein
MSSSLAAWPRQDSTCRPSIPCSSRAAVLSHLGPWVEVMQQLLPLT